MEEDRPMTEREKEYVYTQIVNIIVNIIVIIQNHRRVYA